MAEHLTPLRDARKGRIEAHRIRQGYSIEEFSQMIAEGHAQAFRHIEQNPDIMEEADNIARDYFEGIYKLNYLKLFDVVGQIEFTGEGNIDWDKTFKVSD